MAATLGYIEQSIVGELTEISGSCVTSAIFFFRENGYLDEERDATSLADRQ